MSARWMVCSILLGSLTACGGSELYDDISLESCDAGCTSTPGRSPGCGQAVLESRTLHDDYEAATISFRFASVEEDGRINNNWDLLFGNDPDADRDLLTVNTVTSDRSMIVDLGPLSFCAVPEEVDFDQYPVGQWGEHDNLDAAEGHTYLVRNVDSSTRQLAVFWIRAHQLNRQISIGWYRSPDPERFVPPVTCARQR